MQLSKIVGGQLPPGRSDLVAGITGFKIGHIYSAAGVVITFRDGGQTYRAVSWGGGIACMAITKKQIKSCLRAADQGVETVQNYIHAH